MNSAASRPTISILPSVEASKMPTPSRTALHSRATAACRSSPAFGKYQARRHRATFSNRAPWASAHSWIGVVRIGSNRAWRAGPTNAPKVTGV